MRTLPLVLALLLLASRADASASRVVPADSLQSADTTKSWPLPTTAGKILGAGDAVSEAPSGSVNGSNVTFTLSGTPASAAVLVLRLDGLCLTPTADYTISGTTVTLSVAPATGQVLRATYSK